MHPFIPYKTMNPVNMSAFALSQPLLPFHSPRFSSVCARRPFLFSVSHTRATLDQGEELSDGVISPAMTVTASRIDKDVTEGLSTVDGNRVAAVREQMEFWFSPSNMRRDWFLRRQLDPEGWLDPAVFLMFNKMKTLKADVDDIIMACKTSHELEVSMPAAESFGDDAGQTRVRRSPELPDFKSNDDLELERSFIVSGIPVDSTIADLQAVFQELAQVSYVRIYRNKNFPETPRALICFADVEAANEIADRFENDVPEGCEELRLRRRSRPEDIVGRENHEMKIPEFLVFEVNGLPASWDWRMLHRHVENVFKQGTGQSIRYLLYTGGADHCFVTVNDETEIRSYVSDLHLNGMDVGGSVVSVRILEDEAELREYWRTASEYQARRKARKSEKVTQYQSSGQGLMDRNPKGVIVKLDGLAEDVTWRQLRSGLGLLGSLIYLNHERNSTTCFGRFSTAEEAKSVVEQLSGEDAVQLCESNVDAYVLDGVEEVEYWQRAEEFLRERRSKSNTQE